MDGNSGSKTAPNRKTREIRRLKWTLLSMLGLCKSWSVFITYIIPIIHCTFVQAYQGCVQTPGNGWEPQLVITCGMGNGTAAVHEYRVRALLPCGFDAVAA